MNNLEGIKSKIDNGLYSILSDLEKANKSNFYYTSDLRSVESNKAVGGSVNSPHVDWDGDGDSEAVDIRRSSFNGSPVQLAKLAFSYGATGVGIYDTHVHIDNKATRVESPYFKDFRTMTNQWDKGQSKITSIAYFKNNYNKVLANLRKGKNDLLANKIDDDILIKIGLAAVAILVASGLMSD